MVKIITSVFQLDTNTLSNNRSTKKGKALYNSNHKHDVIQRNSGEINDNTKIDTKINNIS